MAFRRFTMQMDPQRVDASAVIYSATGQALRHGTLGDGVQQLRTTPAGDIWVGYFDEGIFANFGWGGPSGPRPVGSAGLVRFDSHLNQIWVYPENADYPIAAARRFWRRAELADEPADLPSPIDRA